MKALRSISMYALVLLVTAINPGFAQDVQTEKRHEIEKLLELTGAVKIGQQVSSAMVSQFANVLRTSNPDRPKKAIDVLPYSLRRTRNFPKRLQGSNLGW